MRIFTGAYAASQHLERTRTMKAAFLCADTREVAIGDIEDLPARADGWQEVSRREIDAIAQADSKAA